MTQGCEGCICISCRYLATDDCLHTDLCIDCAKEYTTMLCPGWEICDKEKKNDVKRAARQYTDEISEGGMGSA